jgi:IS30 family transposase
MKTLIFPIGNIPEHPVFSPNCTRERQARGQSPAWPRVARNANTNGLIRQYFTKGSSFENITDDDVDTVMHKLNHRLRKTLNYKTPHAVFFTQPEQEAA